MISSMIVAGLAGTRLVRAWMHEDIGEKPRDALELWASSIDTATNDDGDLIVTTPAWKLGTRDFVYDLITCPHCIGFWFTFAATLGLRFRVTRPIVTALAASMILSAFADHYPRFNHRPL